MSVLPPLRTRDISPRFNNQNGFNARRVREVGPLNGIPPGKKIAGQNRLDRPSESQKRARLKEEKTKLKE